MSWSTERTDQAVAHLLDLARRLRVEVHWSNDPEMWQAHIESRQVWVPEPVGAHRYMVGLHELGHVASRVARRWGHRYEEPGGETLVEGAAWAWAAAAADPVFLVGVTSEEWAEVAWHFGSYLWNTAVVEPPASGQQVRI